MSKYELNRTEKIQTTTNGKPENLSESTYTQEYTDERIVHDNRAETKVRESNSILKVLLIGVLLALGIGLVVGILNATSDREDNQINIIEPSEKVIEPTEDTVEPQEPKQETTIIERTIEKAPDLVPVPVPVPQDSNSAPSESNTNAPSESNTNVEINIPNPVNPQSNDSKPSAEPSSSSKSVESKTQNIEQPSSDSKPVENKTQNTEQPSSSESAPAN